MKTKRCRCPECVARLFAHAPPKPEPPATTLIRDGCAVLIVLYGAAVVAFVLWLHLGD